MHQADTLNVRRLRHGRQGDMVIELYRGLAGKKTSHIKNVLSIKLSKPGDQALGYANDPCFRGKAIASPHILRTFRIDEVALDDLQEPINASGNLWGAVMRHIEYPEYPGITGDYFELAGDEYVQVEVTTDGAVVLWSSNLSVDQTIAQVHSQVGDASSSEAGCLIAENGEVNENSSFDVETLALSTPAGIQMFSACYGESTVSWRRPQLKMQDGSHEFAEISYSAQMIDIEALSNLVTSTGTAGVRESLVDAQDTLVRSLGKRALVK